MKHIRGTIIDSYMTEQEKVQKAWIDLLAAVNRGDVKACLKYANYLNYLLYKKNVIEV